MREGLLWYDPDARRPVKQKIAAAAARYLERCKRPANCCHVHPADLVEYPGLVVVADERMPRHHFWVGVDDSLLPAPPQRRSLAAPPATEARVPRAQPVTPPEMAQVRRARRPAAEGGAPAAPVEPKRSPRAKPAGAAPLAAAPAGAPAKAQRTPHPAARANTPAPAPTVRKRPARAQPLVTAPPETASASAPGKAKRAANAVTPPAPKPASPTTRKPDKMKRAGAA